MMTYRGYSAFLMQIVTPDGVCVRWPNGGELERKFIEEFLRLVGFELGLDLPAPIVWWRHPIRAYRRRRALAQLQSLERACATALPHLILALKADTRYVWSAPLPDAPPPLVPPAPATVG